MRVVKKSDSCTRSWLVETERHNGGPIILQLDRASKPAVFQSITARVEDMVHNL